MKLACALFLALAPALPAPAQIISRGSARVRDIALTFDAGADRGYAAQILQTLEQSHVHATFGMTGKWAQANPDLLRRMVRDGDQIINHTYDHQSFTGLSTRSVPLTDHQRISEITQADRIIRAATGRSTKPFFRPPYGDYDQATLILARRLGYRYLVMWTLDSLGWEHLSAPQILSRCLIGLVPGAILLMHVGSQSQDAMALRGVIAGIYQRHYHLVTVAQMVEAH